MIQFDEYGNRNNPTILLLHGAGALDTFTRQYCFANKYHLVVPHLPGAGENAYIPYLPAETISLLHELIKSLHKENIGVVGHSLGAQIVSYGMQFVGCPYVWGGTTPAGFDCSGLTQYVYRHFGIYIGRTSYVQETAGTIISLSQAIPGDLITWNGHAGIYIGNNMVLNAMDPSLGVRTCPLSWITNGNMMIHRIF